ncbi:MAG TPA: hypothetical protein VEV17_25075 [Bryobacteraceae bacterium]|nr:hypothetical protein [Bryobacteraceae bacterium]
MPLRVSVLASGEILLDGRPVDLQQLDQALEAAKGEKRTVWYYREAPGKDAPARAMEVIQLVVKHKLPISISSKPDFSDYVDAKGGSHPRHTGLRMPDVAATVNVEEVFAKVRRIAAGEKQPRGLVIVRPDRTYLVLPPVAETPQLKKIAAGLEQLIPADVQRQVAVIGYTEFSGDSATPGLVEVNKSIPFLGLLMGLSYIGHAVWIFEGHPSALAAGCRDADVLIVDSAMLPFLEAGWQDSAAAVMRSANLLVHDRATFQLRIARKTGTNNARLEFQDQPAHS